MASIERRQTKKGDAFRIKVSLGYDELGNQRFVRSDTIRFDKSMTKRQIEKELMRLSIEYEKKIKDENTDSNGDFLDNPHITFGELAEEWLDLIEASDKQKSSSIQRLKICKERTYQAIGNTEIKKITYRQIQAFIRSLSEDGVNQRTGGGLSAKTQKHYLTLISDVMQYAIRCGIISVNPCRNVEIFHVKTEKPEKDVYSLDEVRAILAAVNEQAPINYRAYFALTAYLGLRRGEVLGLEYKDFNYSNKTVSINRTSNYQSADKGTYTSTPKTKTSRRVLFVPDTVLDIVRLLQAEQEEQRLKLGDLWQDTDRLFIQWDGRPAHPNTFYTWLYKFCQKNGLPFKGLHAFRHSFATQAITNGADVSTVSAILGHSQTSTTLNIYTHAVQAANVKTLNVVADLINGS